MKRKLLMLFVVFGLVLGVSFPVLSQEKGNGYDPLNTMEALNIAIMSIYRITKTCDRVVLDQEYRNILDNLKIGEIESDEEIISLYEEIMDFITNKKLREEERKRVQEIYNLRTKRALYEGISNIRAYGGDPISWVLSFIVSLGSSYFSYQSYKEEYRQQMDEELWQLKKEEVYDLNDLYKQLLRSSWKLLRRYHLPDKYRLTERDIDLFYKTVSMKDPRRALEAFKRISDRFEVYPPFWFYFGKTAQDLGFKDLALRCYDHFEKVRRDVLRRDPFYAEVIRRKVSLISPLSEDLLDKYMNLLVENSFPDRDWINYLFAGLTYYLYGYKDKAKELIETNIVFGTEEDVSGYILGVIKRGGKIDFSRLPEILRRDIERISVSLLSTSSNKLEAGAKLFFMKKYQEAFKILLPLAKGGSPVAQYLLFLMYSEGLGVEKDVKIADRWWWKAKAKEKEPLKEYEIAYRIALEYAQKGDPIAQFIVGRMSYYGQGTRKDYEEAVKWYRKSAEQGNPWGQNNLGVMYQKGLGVPRDYKEAVRWYKKAAEQGNSLAQFNLGCMYLNGLGVEKDYGKAYELFRKSAEQGNSWGQNNLGMMYLNGLGVEKDYEEAVKWYRKSAEQGNSNAQFNLGWMYLKGLGVRKDKVKAYKWFYIASLNGHSEAEKQCKKLEKGGFLGFGALSRDEINEAIRRARKWIKEHPNAVKK